MNSQSFEELPLVTITSPCYNHSKYVIESLESIRNQTYSNIQHIIIDDCSTDDSAYKIQKWIEENEYKCEFVRHKANKGISYNHNLSIEMAKGVFWTGLASDDIALPERTAVFVEYLIKNQEVLMAASDCRFIDENSNIIYKNGTDSFLKYYTAYRKDFNVEEDFGTYKSLLEGNYMPSCIMVRKSVFNKTGVFDTRLKLEDWNMWLRISKISRIAYIDKYLTLYRFHEANTVKLNNLWNDYVRTFLNQGFSNLPYDPQNIYWKKYEEFFLHNFNRANSMLFFKYTPCLPLVKVLSKKIRQKLKNLNVNY